MWPIYTVFLGLSLLLILPQDVIGTCKMEAGPNAPLVLTQFGSKLLLSDSFGTYEREDGETIDFYCGSGFSYNRFYDLILLVIIGVFQLCKRNYNFRDNF